jgi:hypothetical protein
MGSVNSGRPVSQHRELGGPFDVAEQGDELRAPGGTVFDDVTATGAGGGEDGADADETLLWKISREREREMSYG